MQVMAVGDDPGIDVRILERRAHHARRAVEQGDMALKTWVKPVSPLSIASRTVS